MSAATPERRERVAKLWLAAGGKLYREGGRPGDTPKPPRVTHDFAAALDAEADARVEAMREACAKVACEHSFSPLAFSDSIAKAIEAAIRALPVKGSPT